MKEEKCLFLYAGTFFLREHLEVERWMDYEGANVSASTIYLHDTIKDPKWDEFTSLIRGDDVLDEGFFYSVAPRLYWYKFQKKCTFSAQTLQSISTAFPIKATVEDFNECMVHNHSVGQLEKYFYDDGAASRSALELNENQWSKRLVESLSNCEFDFLQGWKFDVWGS